MKRAVCCLALAALALGAGGCGSKSKQAAMAPAPASPPAGATRSPSFGAAPAWQLRDLEGRWVSSDQFKGKVVVLDFWATWCGPCRQEIPGYVDLQKKYADDGLVVIGVSLDEGGPSVVKAFVQKLGVSYLILMSDDQIGRAFGGLQAIPTTFIIDRDGIIRDRKVGAVSAATFAARVRKYLAPAGTAQ